MASTYSTARSLACFGLSMSTGSGERLVDSSVTPEPSTVPSHVNSASPLYSMVTVYTGSRTTMKRTVTFHPRPMYL